MAAQRGRGAQWRPSVLIDAGIGEEYPDFRAGLLALRLEAAGIDPASVTDVVLTHMHFDHIGGLFADGLKDRLRPDVPIHLAAAEAEFWASPDFLPHLHAAAGGGQDPDGHPAVPGRLPQAAARFEAEHEVAPGVIVRRTGGHTPGHSVVHLASGGERLTFLGDAVFPDHFDRPDWHNAFDHDPDEAVRVRVRLLRELAASGEPLVATHLSFPSVGRVAVAGDVFRRAPAYWDY